MQKVGDWHVPFDNHITRRNILTTAKYHHCKPYIRDWTLALDCGAFIGAWSKEMKQDFSEVVAVEMDADNVECVKANVPDATVVHGALHSVTGEKIYYSPDEFPESPIYRVHCVGGKVAPSVTIDELDLTPGFIKMDIQGYETAALMGGVETLKRAKPLLFFEHLHKCYSRYGLDGREVLEFLHDLGACEIAILGSDRIWGWQ